jgi:biopolymer transport protein ExbD
MAFTSSTGGPMVDINVTPLVDVMLVLLIIFMLAVPALSYPLQMDLPQPGPQPKPTAATPDPIRIHIDAGNSLSWNGSPIALTALQARFDNVAIASRGADGRLDVNAQPKIQIETDSQADYDALAKVLSRAKNADLLKIEFVGVGPTQ